MKRALRYLRNLVVVLAIMVGTAALTVWFMAVRDERLRKASQPTSPQLAETREVQTPASAPKSAEITSPDGDSQWSRDEIRTLRRHVGNQTVLALLEILRERDGAPVNYHELMERTGRTMPQVRADLAVFSRAAKKVEGHDTWPIDVADPTDGESNIAYTAPKSYLDWWFED